MFSVVSGGEVRFRSGALTNITGLTVCMRVLLEKSYYSVQLSFENTTDAVSYTGPTSTGYYHYLQVKGEPVRFEKFSLGIYRMFWPWRNRCFTWESSTGMAQLWFDGTMSIRKGVARGQDAGKPREKAGDSGTQAAVGSVVGFCGHGYVHKRALWNFSDRQGVDNHMVFSGQAELTLSGFEGQVADVYVWDSALSVKALYCYLSLNHTFPPGTILDWNRIQYRTSGYVVLQAAYLNPFSEKSSGRKRQKRGRGQRVFRGGAEERLVL
ncbi:hypothetical protein NFI96_004546 [Prochilodus magdalenae]|nr:hypothetical protein NFI96_004546 [Prochilodus magdalenae]